MLLNSMIDLHNIDNINVTDISDLEIFACLTKEFKRQQDHIELIASENYASKNVLALGGSILTNKYAEGYPGRRYYGGCTFVDEIENIAIDRAKKLFNCNFANVQPHSGSQANQAVMLALIKPGDTILSLSLDHGGHLTHGAKPNLSGKWFNIVHYFVDRDTYLIDYNKVLDLAKIHKPKLIIAGASAYPRIIDFSKFRAIADQVGAYLLADMAHISGLVAANEHQNPVKFAHVVTSTTHKTLRGPRGGIILCDDVELAKKFNKAIFPGLQGGPLMHIIAAKAACFKEALEPSFKNYIIQVKKNAQKKAETLINRDVEVITGGTDNHIVLVDLRNKSLKGNEAEIELEKSYITCNKNSVPFDTEKPFYTSGLRFGSAACTTRGFQEEEFIIIANQIANVLEAMAQNKNLAEVRKEILVEISKITDKYPIYKE